MSSLGEEVSDARTAMQMREVAIMASRIAIPAVRDALPYEFLDENAEQAVAFFEQWLPLLEPMQRLEAAEWVAAECMTSLVHVPHAYGIGARLHMSAIVEAADALATNLKSFMALTDGPDAEVTSGNAERVARLALQLRAVHAELGEVLASVIDSSQASETGDLS